MIGTQIDIGAVELTGAGSASALASVTPKSLAFGNVPYGSNSPMSVTLSNAGDGGTVNVGAVTVAGSTDFAVTNSSCTTGLAVGATCSITVTFKPTTVVAENATLNIPTDDPTNPTLAVTVTGTGTPVPLVITASSTTVAYGTAIPVITPSAFAGFVNGDTSASLTTQPTCSTTYKPTSTVSGSPYASSCSGAVDPNYIISYQPGSVTVTRAALTITASSLGMPYGGPLPAIQPIFVGFANGETEAVLTTQPTCSTTATAASTVSGNPYPTSCSGAASANYTISYVAGTLNVTPLTASVTPKPASKVYGTADPSPLTTGTLTGFRLADGVTATYTRTLGETAATYTISATLAPPAVLGNYAITYNTAAFTINKAFTLTKITAHAPNPSNTNQAITVAANVSPQITNTPTGTVTFTASSGESCVGTLTSGAASCSLTLHTAGTLKLAAAYSGDGNFTSSASASVNHTVTGTGVLTVNPTSFNFPDTLLGRGSLSSVIALTNSGTAPVTTLSYRFTDSAYVTGGGTTCGTVLNPAATCNIVVRFRPTTLGAHPATMNINAGGVSKATVSLIGNGVQPAVQLSTTSLQFGGVLSGQTSMLPVTLTNSGTGTLTILNITPGPTSLGAFVSSNNCPAGGLGVGLSCTINVTFKASGAKTPRTGTLSIADNAPGSPHKVSLSGTVQ